jgi:phosphoribosylglycinamide formyltransferase-1
MRGSIRGALDRARGRRYCPDVSTPLRIAALASGRGSNLAAILRAIDRSDLDAAVVLVVSNNAGSGALALARDRGIEARHVSAKTHDDPGAALLDALTGADTELVVLAGYLRMLDPRVVAAFAGRAINIHPAPLPRFGGPGMYGRHVHEAVLGAGVDATGPTVHRVDEEYDRGEVLAHRRVPVLPGDTPDTLAARVLEAEHDLYWRVIDAHYVRGR